MLSSPVGWLVSIPISDPTFADDYQESKTFPARWTSLSVLLSNLDGQDATRKLTYVNELAAFMAGRAKAPILTNDTNSRRDHANLSAIYRTWLFYSIIPRRSRQSIRTGEDYEYTAREMYVDVHSEYNIVCYPTRSTGPSVAYCHASSCFMLHTIKSKQLKYPPLRDVEKTTWASQAVLWTRSSQPV